MLQIFGWLSVAAVPVAAWWVAVSPLALGRGPPARLPAAALAALERPVFSFFVAMALLGAMNGIPCEYYFDYGRAHVSLPTFVK